MSRYYEISVDIPNVPPGKDTDIISAVKQVWAFENWDNDDPYPDPNRPGWVNLRASGKSTLCNGESEEDFAGRVCIAVWRAAGMYLEVEVIASNLEESPCEIFTFNERQYDDWCIKGPPNTRVIDHIIAVASKAYGNLDVFGEDDLVSGYFRNRNFCGGDGLAQFIADELRETVDNAAPLKDQLLQAANTLLTASNQIQNVVQALLSDTTWEDPNA